MIGSLSIAAWPALKPVRLMLGETTFLAILALALLRWSA
ncbi:hypothetical protein VAR608DRAFT_5202 [Variovorax sp. HW608]|nr:hypothetical protein VAR608DRAFT_5202 [Variovorax sp. HW608]